MKKHEKLKNDSRVQSIEKRISTESEDGIFPNYKDKVPNPTRKWNLGQHGTNLYSRSWKNSRIK